MSIHNNTLKLEGLKAIARALPDFTYGEYSVENNDAGGQTYDVKISTDDPGKQKIRSILDRSITEYSDSSLTSVGRYAFGYCKLLTSINLPNVTNVEAEAFNFCNNLNNVNLPNVKMIDDRAFSSCWSLTNIDFAQDVTNIGISAFYNCTRIKSVYLPKARYLKSSSFAGCSALEVADCPVINYVDGYVFENCHNLRSVDAGVNATSIGNASFNCCYSLKRVILRTSSRVISMNNKNAFNLCYHIHGTVNATYNPNGDKDGYIYVPRALVDRYKSATNWSTFASQIRALEDYTVDGTITGELDETKFDIP